ncbi:MAG: TIGR03086 family protein [Geodermatophilaceae bacterium]|nr:TIGR03086 family protein [Geodermatophilaceae bacterium]
MTRTPAARRPRESTIAQRYRAHADAFERKVAGVRPDQWSDPSPCADWTARDVVGHVIDMHGVMLRPLDRQLSPAPSLQDDPLAAFRAAREDVEALLDDPELAAVEHDSPGGRMSVEAHVDQVVSEDLVLHGWDLARATGQDDTIDPDDVERMWPSAQTIGEEMRTPNLFGPGILVYGPEVEVAADAPLHDRLLGAIGRDPGWAGRVNG